MERLDFMGWMKYNNGMITQELTVVLGQMTVGEQKKLGGCATRLIAMRKIPKLKKYTTEDFLEFAKVTDREATQGKTVPASVVLADLRKKRRSVSA